MRLIIEIDLPDGSTPLDNALIKEEYMAVVRDRLVLGSIMKALDMMAYMKNIGKSEEEIKKVTDIYEYQADLFEAMRMRFEE